MPTGQTIFTPRSALLAVALAVRFAMLVARVAVAAPAPAGPRDILAHAGTPCVAAHR